MRTIDSASNKTYKSAKSLLTRKGRYQQEKFLVEGVRNIELAMVHDYPLEAIFLREDCKEQEVMQTIIRSFEDKILVLSSKLFEQLSDTIHSQGVIAVAPMMHRQFQDDDEIILILDKVQDPGNTGNLIRTADSAGIRSIFYTEGTMDFYSPKVVRSAVGSVFYMNFYKMEDVAALKKLGYHIVAAALDQAVSYQEMDAGRKMALVLGNEANGITQELLMQADQRVKIPIYGNAESLNVAAAGAILMYKLRELSEQENCKGV